MSVTEKICSICLVYFIKPKIIDCRHTFCESCLDVYVKKVARNNQFPCPLCTKTITIPEGGVNDFPKNFHALRKKKPVPVPRRKRNVPVILPTEESVSVARRKQNYLVLVSTEESVSVQRRKINVPFNLPTEEPVSVLRGKSNIPVNLPTKENERQIVNPLCHRHMEEKRSYCKDCNIAICYTCFITEHPGHTLQNLVLLSTEESVSVQGRKINVPVNFPTEEPVSVPREKSNIPVNLPTKENERQIVNPLCQRHMEEKRSYCKDCKSTICYTCFITEHPGHTLQNREDVEPDLKIIREQLEEHVRAAIACYQSMVESLKKDTLTLAQQYAVECGKVDQRIKLMCQIIKDAGKTIKMKMKDSNLEHTKVIRKKIKAVEQQTRQIMEIDKQIGERVTRNQLEEMWKTTQNLIQDNSHKDLAVPDYFCPQFQDGVTDTVELSKQIGQIHNMGDGRCVYGQTNGYVYGQNPGYVNGQ